MKICKKCGLSKPVSDYAKCSKTKSGVRAVCKPCGAAYTREWNERNPGKNRKAVLEWHKKHRDKGAKRSGKRRADKRQAVPIWFEADAVANVYKKAQEFGFQVDHIVPLKGKTVCGLHCWANLQLLDGSLNASKNNREWPDMPIPENLKIVSPKVSNEI